MKYQRTSGRPDRRTAPDPGWRVVSDAADRSRYSAIGGYTPEKLRALFAAANSGDIEQMCLAARDILERNWDIQGALDQRALALAGTPWEVSPGGSGPRDAEAAKAFKTALENAGDSELNNFCELVFAAADAIVLPFAAFKLVWGDGGSLDGFQIVEPWHFTLRDSFAPRLVCDGFPQGMELPPAAFAIHRVQRREDPARGGKFRALAWLHCFQNWPIKDLFSFIERFGMPFVVAKVDQRTWDEERAVLHRLIRNFGPSGGGVFTKSTELQLLNAANTGGDNVYFRALEFTHDAIYTLLTGQLASSSDASGMSNGTAQTAVRQDFLEADARALESTVRTQIAEPWTKFQFGPGVAAPRLHFAVEPAEDRAQLAQTVSALAQAGYRADPAELSERFGLKLEDVGPVGQAGPAVQAGLLTATPEIEEQTRSELGLPPVSDAVRKAWEATGGIRQPITLKAAEAEAVNNALETDNAAMSAEKPEPGLADALEQWLGPLARELDDLAGKDDLSEREFAQRLRDCADGKKFGSSEKFEELMAGDMEKKYRESLGRN